MAFPTADFNAWLKTQLGSEGWPVTASQATAGKGIIFTQDGYIPDHPDRLVCTTPGTGPGFLDDEAQVVRHSVQIHTRGAAESAGDAEALATAVDKLLIFAVRPKFGPKLCIGIDHTGGPPSSFQPDRRPRYTFICNYLFTIQAW